MEQNPSKPRSVAIVAHPRPRVCAVVAIELPRLPTYLSEAGPVLGPGRHFAAVTRLAAFGERGLDLRSF
jgi:hypothetical protein